MNLNQRLDKRIEYNAYLESRKSNSNVWFVDFHRNRLRQLTHRLNIAVKSI